MSAWPGQRQLGGSEDVVVRLAGDVGAIEARRAGHQLRLVPAGARRARLDLSRVHSIDLSAVDSLLDAARSLRQRGVEVRATPSWADSVLQLTGRWGSDAVPARDGADASATPHAAVARSGPSALAR